MPSIRLRGMTWDHRRAIDPLRATQVTFADLHPGIEIEWSSRPLHGFEFTPVAVGNPHAVVRREFCDLDVVRLGPLVECHTRFPGRTNVQLVRVTGPHELEIGIWERGVGVTRSSGSSSVAAAAAAVANGWVESPVTVKVPGGGALTVTLADGRARLTGPVEEICRGEVVLGEPRAPR